MLQAKKVIPRNAAKSPNLTSIAPKVTIAQKLAAETKGSDAKKLETIKIKAAPPKPVVIPTRLSELLAIAREKSDAGVSQSDIIEWVCGVARRYEIRVRYDEHVQDDESSETTEDTPEILDADLNLPAQPSAARDAEESDIDNTTGAIEYSPIAAVEIKTRPSSEPEAKLKSAGKRRKRGKPVPVQTYRLKNGSRVLVLEQILNPDQFDADGESATETETSSVGSSDMGALDDIHRESTSCRLILSCDRKNVRTTVPICAECNGAVIDTKTWRTLAIPPRAFNPRPITREIDRLLAAGAFDMIHVDDGTVVTIYNWIHPRYGPIWDLSSSNGYGVSTLRWMGDKTFAEVVFEVASLYPSFIESTKAELIRSPNGEPRLHFGNLDPGKCYTVGFRHHDFHPMIADPQRMWQIQSVDLKTGTVSYGNTAGLPGIPHQIMGSMAELSVEIFGVVDATTGATRRSGPERPALAKCSVPMSSGGVVIPGTADIRLEHLVAYGADSLAIAIAHVAESKGARAKDATGLPRHIHYGFILRSRDVTATKEHSDFLVESSLLQKVRQIVYERPPKSMREDIDHRSRLEFNALRSHLTGTNRSTFEALFPQWHEKFLRYDEFINNVIHTIQQIHRQTAMGAAAKDKPARTATMEVATALLTHIRRHETIAPFHKDTESIIRDYVMNPGYTLLFMRAMVSAAR